MKRHFLGAFFLAYLLPVVGCSGQTSKVGLTFGNFISSEPYQISYSKILDKMEDKENMIVASYYSSIGSCECQTTFYEVLKDFINTTNYNVYLFDCDSIEGERDEFNFINPGYSSPILYIINKGKIKQTFKYTQKANEKIFSNVEELTKKITKYFDRPHYYYVDKTYIDNNLSKQNKVGLCFVRESCPDCKYLIPNFMIPYANNHKLMTDIWVFDLDPYYNTDAYQNLKDEYQLSESANPTFGYRQGVVPTTHYYENGKLISANVYFNDKVELDKESEKYTITETYYTEERVKNLSYINDEFVLLNMTIKNEEIVSGHWLSSYSSILHNQIIEKFYEKYFL